MMAAVSLDDRYRLENGTAVMTGVQALVRLPIDQRRADRRAGIETAALISGYEGSPLGGYDLELARSVALLSELDIVFRPALNEESGATAVMGSQQAYRQPAARYQGTVGFWYGKAPGLDRAADAIRHGNLIGVHRHGGAIACVGDDAAAKSSTVPSGSEMSLMEMMLPVLVPAYPHEVLDLGLHGVALSRVSGLWAGLKIATSVADGSETVELSPDRVAPVTPDVVVDGRPYHHEVSAHMLGEPLLALERSLVGPRIEIARRYGVANGLNRTVRRGPGDRLGLIAAGKVWRDLVEALDLLGLGDRELERYGIRLLKIGMAFPLDRGTVREFADGLTDVLIVEEKRAFIELLVKEALYGVTGAPRVAGKADAQGQPLLSAAGELDAALVARAVASWLLSREEIEHVRRSADELGALGAGALRTAAPLVRTPYFCSGCPHSTGTKVPEAALVGGGIGCHGLALLMHEEQVGNVLGLSQMGGEGSIWIGMSPFVSTDHLIQNVGDGTFFHSASLGLRAAVAAGVNITFKILFNSAVAMTGGQPVIGGRSVQELTYLLAAEGVVRTIVTTDDTARYRHAHLADNAAAWPRSRIVEAQEELARVPGVTALIHDQECATELRRKRKRGLAPEPAARIFINERVCEGCGDCGQKSNCLSVHPVDSEFGRKTRIHQASCNKDTTCLQGDCPSFITVIGGKAVPPRLPDPISASELPQPRSRVDSERFGMRFAGIGGTGVVTAAQILAMAARLDGRHVAGFDQVGLAQKYGAVISDLRIASAPVAGANRLSPGRCDLLIACDLVAATQPNVLAALSPERSFAVLSTSVAPTADQVVSPAAPPTDVDALAQTIERRLRGDASIRIDGPQIALTLFGTDQVANMLLVGAAYQAGALPIDIGAIERAVALNGVSVELNLQALRRGRQAVCDPVGLQRALVQFGPPRPATAMTSIARPLITAVGAPPGTELRRLVDVRVPDLVEYQNRDYAWHYVELVALARATEEERLQIRDGPLALAVARHLHKLMAYKDEYEVARLHLDEALAGSITAEFGPGARIAWNLQPPFLRRLGLGKVAVGPWFRPVFSGLRAMRGLRGTRCDPFGRTVIRKLERELIVEYETTVRLLLRDLDAHNHAVAVQIAELPDAVRGYEDIKLANIRRYRTNLRDGLQRFAATRIEQSSVV